MRCVLVDHARKPKKPRKRPRSQNCFALDTLVAEFERVEQIDLIALDEALEDLKVCSERSYQIVTLHFFSGLRFKEIGRYLDVSTSTVEKDWKFARSWLLDRLDEGT